MIVRELIHVETIQELKELPLDAYARVFVFGKTTVGDSLGGFYYWDSSATGAEDTVYMNIIPSNHSTIGRWRRVFAKAASLPHGILINNSGVKTFHAPGVTNSAGEVSLNLTEDNTVNGPALFTDIFFNISRAKTTAASPSQSVNSYTKSLSANLKNTVHGFYTPNPITITLGLVYGPFAAAGAGVPVQFEIKGI